MNGSQLLLAFAVVMIVVAASMLRGRGSDGDPSVRINPQIAVRLVAIGFLTGLLSGFFGIGGGMPILNAVSSSLFSVGAFGTTTAINYAISGLIDWQIAALFLAGGVVGGVIGMRAAVSLSRSKGVLTRIFALVILAAGFYMVMRSVVALHLL